MRRRRSRKDSRIWNCWLDCISCIAAGWHWLELSQVPSHSGVKLSPHLSPFCSESVSPAPLPQKIAGSLCLSLLLKPCHKNSLLHIRDQPPLLLWCRESPG